MNIDDHKKLVIFSYPRSGTKLLANVLTQAGHHNFGEWFDTWTSYIDQNNMEAVRLPPPLISKKYAESKALRAPYIHAAETLQRLSKFDFSKDKFTVTIWNENLELCPMLASSFSDCTWLCPTRNTWDQLLSWAVVNMNRNPNGGITSQPVSVPTEFFAKQYWKLHRITLIQDLYVKQGKGIRINFDKLISGQEDFGFKYKVTSTDQHSDIESLILNIKEIRTLYKALEEIRKSV